MMRGLASAPPSHGTFIVREPTINERDVRSAAIEDDGGDYLSYQLLAEFDALNPTAAAQACQQAAVSGRGRLQRRARRSARHLANTRPIQTVLAKTPVAPLPAFVWIEALLLCLGAIASLYVSNQVLASYAVKSGSDQFATDPIGARMFAVLPILAGLGFKVFEHRLVTDGAKHLYASIAYAVGLATFLIWSAMAALTFAPDTGANWLTGIDYWWAPAALVMTHVLADCAWGYLLFSGAEQLFLGNRKWLTISNPAYAVARKEADDASKALQANLAELAAAANYLIAVAQSREKLKARIELELDRATALWRDAQTIGQAVARARFLDISNQGW